MSTDRPPTGGPADDAFAPPAPEPTEPLGHAEPTRAVPTVEPTQSIPTAEPTRAIPTFEPSPADLGGWTHVPSAAPAEPGPQGWPPPGGPPGNWTAAPPQRLAGYPSPPLPRQRGHGWLVALATLAAVVVVSLVAALAGPQLIRLSAHRAGAAPVPSATRGGAPTTKPASATPAPTSAPTKTMPTDPLLVLKKNPIYAVKVPATCPSQSIPRSQSSYHSQVDKLVACLNTAWKKALTPTAVEFKKPKVKFYSTSFTSPCGRLGTTFPASYCTANSTLYFSRAAYVQGRYFRLSVAQFVFHEYAHHVQKLAGIFGSIQAMKESEAVTKRRIELQAHCMAHYELTVSSVGFSSDDERSIKYQWDFTNDPSGHGSTKAERYWGERGLAARTVGACNTWSVKASKVK
ncbi:MAG: neutral zinc metallopeptidase [Propionicimonas sp.]